MILFLLLIHCPNRFSFCEVTSKLFKTEEDALQALLLRCVAILERTDAWHAQGLPRAKEDLLEVICSYYEEHPEEHFDLKEVYIQ